MMYNTEMINMLGYGIIFAFVVLCLLIGAMLFVLYDKMTRVIVAAVEMHARGIINQVENSRGTVIKILRKEIDLVLSDLKPIKRSIPNVISHLYDIEKSKLFGARLRSWRHKLQLTQKDVFNRSGVCVGRISDIERGINPSEDERGILSRMMTAEALVAPDKPEGDLIENVKVEFKPDGALEFEKKKNELEV